MRAGSSSPARSQLGGSTWLALGAVKVTVQSQRMLSPSGSPVSLPRPVGMSTATTLALRKPAFTSATARRAAPRAGPASPVPRIASTMTVESATAGRTPRQASSVAATVAAWSCAASIFQLARASVERDGGSASRTTLRSRRGKSSSSCRATASPSPPLLPLPQRTSTFSRPRSGNSRRRSRVTAAAALSIRTRLGTPRSAIVARSASRISAAVRTRRIRLPVPASSARAPSSCRSRPARRRRRCAFPWAG